MEEQAAQEEAWRRKISAQNQRLLWCLFGFLMLCPLGYFYTVWQRDNVYQTVVEHARTNRWSGMVIFLE